MRRPATRSDVAARAGVSTAVVSYVVNGGPRNVAPATRQRVLDVIAELGYRPNANARALRASTSRTIGLIVPTISNPYFAELSEALEAAAFAQGRTVLVGSSHDDVARETRYLDEFIERRVDGVVLVSVGEDPAIQAALDAEIPVVLLDRPAVNLQVPCITIDNEAAGFAATSHLVGHGHTRIACITGPADQAVARARQGGWRRALDGAGIADLDRMTIAAEFSAVGGYDAARSLFTSTDVTAVFVCSDSQSQGVVAAARDLGRVVPRDVAVIGFDGTSQTQFSEPRLSVVAQPLPEMARAALAALSDPEQAPPTIPFDLVIRSSCGC